MRTPTVEHLSIDAFRPTILATVLNFPKDSYKFPRTVPVKGMPHARRLLFSKFKLASQIEKFTEKLRKHITYKGFDIQMEMNSRKTLEVTLVMQIKPAPTSTVDESAFRQERTSVRKSIAAALNIKNKEDYYGYRSKNIHNGCEILFCQYTKIEPCGRLANIIKRKLHYYDVTCLFNGEGLVVTCTKQENPTREIPHGLKELPTITEVIIPKEVVEHAGEPVIVKSTVEEVTESTIVTKVPSIKQQIIDCLQEMINSGTSIQYIKHRLECSDAELLGLLDVDNHTVSCETVARLSKIANTKFQF
jgi:hypothetical protein